MVEQVIPLTTLSEAQRRQALERFAVLRPALEEGASQTQIARDHQMALSTVQRWIKSYREKGLAGLAPATRSDKGKSRSLPEQAITLVEGLALQTPPRSAASIHRQVVEIAKEQGWKPPSYERVRLIIKSLDPALVTLLPARGHPCQCHVAGRSYPTGCVVARRSRRTGQALPHRDRR